MDHIQPFLDYFAKDPTWAIVIVFLIAFGEALLIIGLFVPSTAVLVGAGMLVGTGHLEFWPVLIATITGAILGDQLSYWAGRIFGDRLKTLWPLRNYASLVDKGEAFVKLHGGKSIAIGRFVPGVKAVVPGIVGMLGMSQLFFLFVNITSGIFWGIAHVVPGVLLGQGVAIAGDLSGRLLILLIALFALLAGLGWLVRLSAAYLVPVYSKMLDYISEWFKGLGSRPLYRLGRSVSPNHPQSFQVAILSAILFISIAVFAFLTRSALRAGYTSNLDLSINSVMRELRNAPGDDIFAYVSVLGDIPVAGSVFAIVVIWFLLRRVWPTAIASLVLLACTYIFALLLRKIEAVTGDSTQYSTVLNASFPSDEMLLSTLSFGSLAILAGHAMSRWSKALLVSLGSIIVIMVGFARLYLGLEWFSDTLAGVFLGLIAVAMFGFIVESMPMRRINPLGLVAGALLTYIFAFSILAPKLAEDRIAFVEQTTKPVLIEKTRWLNSEWKSLPKRRVDLAGRPEEIFVAQYAGKIENLDEVLKAQGWQIDQQWTWRQGLKYLDDKSTLATLPPKPLLHEGLKAKTTATMTSNSNPNRRFVLRAFKSPLAVGSTDSSMPLFFVTLTIDSLQNRVKYFALPKLQTPEAQEKLLIEQSLETIERSIASTNGESKLLVVPEQ